MAEDDDPWEAWKAQQIRAREGSVIPGTTVEQPQVGQGEALVRGIERGGSLGFAPKIKGLQEASGIAPGVFEGLSRKLPEGAAQSVGGVAGRMADIGTQGLQPMLVRTATGALRMIWGDPKAKENYAKTTGAEQERNRIAEAQNPGTTLAGQAIGGLASPMPGLAAGGRLLPYAGKSALAAGGYGAAQTVGESRDNAPSAGDLGLGTGVGAAVGGTLPFIGRAATYLGAYPLNYLRNVIQPQRGAERAIGQAAQEQARAGPAAAQQAISRQQFANEPEAVLADLLGTPGHDLARSAANQAPEARALMQGVLAERSHGGPNSVGRQGRTVDEINQMFGPTPSSEIRETVLREGRREAGPLYKFAQEQGNYDLTQGPAGSAGLNTLLERSPALRRAAGEAEAALQNRAAGQENPWNGVRNLEYWDQVKKQLDSQINVARRAGNNAEVQSLAGVKDALVERLDRQVPGYAEARGVAGDYLGADTAVKAGEQLYNRKQDIHQALRAFRRLDQSDQQLYKQGLMDRIRTEASQNPNFWNKVERNQGGLQEKLHGILTPAEFNQLEARSHIERIFQATHNNLAGQSSTARQIKQGILTSTGGAGLGYTLGSGGENNPYGGAIGLGVGAPTLGGIGTALLTLQDRRMATLIARGLMTRDTALLDRVAQAAARSNEHVRALRELARGLTLGGARAGASGEATRTGEATQ